MPLHSTLFSPGRGRVGPPGSGPSAGRWRPGAFRFKHGVMPLKIEHFPSVADAAAGSALWQSLLVLEPAGGAAARSHVYFGSRGFPPGHIEEGTISSPTKVLRQVS